MQLRILTLNFVEMMAYVRKYFNVKTYLTIFIAQKFSDLRYTLTVNVLSMLPKCPKDEAN